MSHVHAQKTPHTLVGAVLAALLAIAFTLGWAPATHAHDVLVDNVPGNNEVLPEAPDEIVLTFNNSVLDMGADATVVRVTDASGTELETGTPTVQNRNVVTKLDGLPDGAYRVVWRVVSSDGHPIQGAFAFAVGSDGEAALETLPAIGETPASDADAADDDAVSLPVIIGVGAVVVVLAVAAVFVLMRRRKTS